jgi:hypothetical protein
MQVVIQWLRVSEVNYELEQRAQSVKDEEE